MNSVKVSSIFFKILWLGGFMILSIISLNLEKQILQTANETYNFLPVIWAKPFIALIFGIYISIVFVKNWSLSINQPLLWSLAIPCIIISFVYPILATLSNAGHLPAFINSSSIALMFQKFYSTNVFGIMGGLTIIHSLFNAPSKQ